MPILDLKRPFNWGGIQVFPHRASAIVIAFLAFLAPSCGSEDRQVPSGNGEASASESITVTVDEDGWFTFSGNRLFRPQSADPSECVEVSTALAMDEGPICSSLDLPRFVQLVAIYQGPTILNQLGQEEAEQIGLMGLLLYSTEEISSGSLRFSTERAGLALSKSESSHDSYVAFLFPGSAQELEAEFTTIDGRRVTCEIGDLESSLVNKDQCDSEEG